MGHKITGHGEYIHASQGLLTMARGRRQQEDHTLDGQTLRKPHWHMQVGLPAFEICSVPYMVHWSDSRDV